MKVVTKSWILWLHRRGTGQLTLGSDRMRQISSFFVSLFRGSRLQRCTTATRSGTGSDTKKKTKGVPFVVVVVVGGGIFFLWRSLDKSNRNRSVVLWFSSVSADRAPF